MYTLTDNAPYTVKSAWHLHAAKTAMCAGDLPKAAKHRRLADAYTRTAAHGDIQVVVCL